MLAIHQWSGMSLRNQVFIDKIPDLLQRIGEIQYKIEMMLNS